MEQKILMHILNMLSQKDGGADTVYRDEALAGQILEYIRDERIPETIRRAGITEQHLPAYLNMRLAMFRDRSAESCMYYFRHRTALAELRRLAEYYRTAPPEERELGKLRIRELAGSLGDDPTGREMAVEALQYAGYTD